MAASGSVSVKTRLASVVVAILSLFGCQLVAGDFDITKFEKEATGFCKKGEFRCNGEFLLTCASDQSDWVLDQICPTSDLCDSKLGACRVCTTGDQRCDGAAREECNEDGTAWTEVETCDSASMCNPTFCGSCRPGEVACRGTGETVERELWRCGEDGTWSGEALDTCNTAGICKVSLDIARVDPAWSGKCAKTECEVPGKYECLGNELRRCRQDLTGWDVVDTCTTPEVCARGVEEATRTEGVVDMCPAGCLSAGMTVCEGQYLRRCRDDLTGYDTAPEPCPDGTDCNPVEGACTEPCIAGTVQCNGSQLRRCKSDATWEELAMCASPVLCIITGYDGERATSGECVPPGCPMAGEYKCEGAALYECRPDLSTWDTVSTCFSADLCSAADKRCNEPVCAPDELRCFGNELRRCNAGLTGWDMVETCETGQFCSNDPADPGCKLECPSPTRCNGAELEACTPNGWVRRSTCATNDLCQCTLNGSCTLGLGTDGCGTPVCGGTMTNHQCSGAILQRCQAGRNGWDTVEECGSAALCYPGAPPMFQMGYCATCPTAGEVRCATVSGGTRLETCSPDRKTWNVSQTCGTQGCIDAGSMDYCAICTAGQVRCSSAILQRCGTDRRSWIETTCASASLCDAANNQCDICVPNSNHCETSVLHHCSSDGQQDQTQTCANYCDATMGQCDACVPGSTRCANANLLTCTADGQGETSTDCLTAALCDALNKRCKPPVCTVGQKRCSGNQPQQCATGRDTWESAGAACATAALCNDATATCTAPTCAVGERRCGNGGQPEQCNTDRTNWVPVGSACATPQLCTGMGVCNMPACEVGQIRCLGGQPQRCKTDRTGWDPIGTPCLSQGLCDATTGTCKPPVCQPNQTQCTGDQPQVCKGDLTGWDPAGPRCVTAGLCDAATGTCRDPVCATGQTRCNGNQPEICRADRTGYQPNGDPCATAALCNAGNGTCTAPTCQPGQTRCDGAQVQRCNADQNDWTSMGMPTCATAALCNADTGTCDTAECTPGQRRCNGIQPEVCNADQTGWTSMGLAACATTALCDTATGTCIAPTCAPNQRQCDGAQPQQCNANQNGWDDAGDPCDTVELCNATGPMIGTCSPAACGVNQERCVGAQPEICNSGRTAFVSDGPVCASNPLCVANMTSGDARCTAPTCTAGQRQCVGAALQTCNSTLNGWMTLDTCASAGLCQISAMGTGNTCEPPRCAADEWRCSGANLQQCLADLTGFMLVTMCAQNEICDATGHECDQCMAGEMQCADPEILQSCSTAGHWMDLEDCALMGRLCDETLLMCVEPPPPMQ